MSNPDISIFVPTYNRSEYLDECLSSIILNIKDFNIPLYVSDNASTDNTDDIVKKYKKIYNSLVYIKHPDNIGLDRNQLKFIEYVTTKYCLMIADDDAMCKNSISIILNIIKEEPSSDLFLLNAVHYSENMKRPKHKNFNIKKNLIIENPITFLDKYFFFMHFSTIIVNMNYLKTVSFEKYIETYHAYCGVVFEYLKDICERRNKVRIKIISEPVIKIRDGKKTYSFQKIDVLYKRFPSFFVALPDFYKKIAEKKLKELMKSYTNLLLLINLRSKCVLTYSNRVKFYYYLNFFQKVKIYMLSIVPVNIILLGIKPYKIIKKFAVKFRNQ